MTNGTQDRTDLSEPQKEKRQIEKLHFQEEQRSERSGIKQLSDEFINSSGLHGLNKLQPGDISAIRRMQERPKDLQEEKRRTEKIHSEDEQRPERSGIKQLSDEFINSSGLHGLNKLQSGDIPVIRRLIWMVLILGSAGYLVYIIVVELKNYYKYPTFTNIDVDHSNTMSFPSVTICNLSPYNKSKTFAATNDYRYLNYYLRGSESYHKYYQDINWHDPYYQNDIYTRPFSREMFMNMSMDLWRMFPMCKFDLLPMTCDEYIQAVFTEFGPCFIFNKDGHLKTNRTGANYNLVLKIFIDQANYYFGNSEGSGIKVIIHEPGSFPNIFNEGFVLPPGMYVYAAVTKKVNKHLPAPYKSYVDSYCLDTESPDFENVNKFSNYSVYSCLMECRIETAREKGGCVIPFVVDDPPYCSMRTTFTFNHYLGRSFYDDTLMAKCHQRCRLPCKTVAYEVKLSFADYPSKFTAGLAQMFEPIPNTDMFDYYRKNYLFLNIYFERLEVIMWEQVPVYTSVGNVLANLGGMMGLFLGASLLTLAEIVEYVVFIFGNGVKRTKNRVSDVKSTSP